MPPKSKITREMIIEAAFKIIENEGVENVNARRISQELNCSTQPVLYYFSTIEEIKATVYEKVDSYHSGYISNIQGKYENPMLEIGVNYIKFADEEKNLFRFLFQSNKFEKRSLDDLFDDEGVSSILDILGKEIGTQREETKCIFSSIFLTVHGYASLLANNSMNYDEGYIIKILNDTLDGLIKLKIED